MVGIYREDVASSRDAGAATARTVLLTTANDGYREILTSWMCRCRELGLKFVVHCQDETLFAYLKTQVCGPAPPHARYLRGSTYK